MQRKIKQRLVRQLRQAVIELRQLGNQLERNLARRPQPNSGVLIA